MRTFIPAGTAVLTMLGINGNEFYSLNLDLSHNYFSTILQYKNLGNKDMVIFTGGDTKV